MKIKGVIEDLKFKKLKKYLYEVCFNNMIFFCKDIKIVGYKNEN